MNASAAADPDLFLTSAEIERLTGFKRRKEQLEALKASGYRHELNRRGEILVARAHVEYRFGAGVKPAPEPHFDVFARRA